MIPRIIHQTWKEREIPRKFMKYRETWLAHHPDWDYRLWTDADNLELVENNYPWLLETYHAFPFVIQRTDLARILYLHKHGGLYADLDFECLKPLDELLGDPRIVLGRECRGAGHYFEGRDYACNALMASPPGHPFWESLLKRMIAEFRPYRWWRHKALYVLATTGPRILNEEVDEYLGQHDDVTVYPSDYFYAAPYVEYRPLVRRQIAEKVDSYAIHHFAGSWMTPTRQCLRMAEYWLRRVVAGPRRKNVS